MFQPIPLHQRLGLRSDFSIWKSEGLFLSAHTGRYCVFVYRAGQIFVHHGLDNFVPGPLPEDWLIIWLFYVVLWRDLFIAFTSIILGSVFSTDNFRCVDTMIAVVVITSPSSAVLCWLADYRHRHRLTSSLTTNYLFFDHHHPLCCVDTLIIVFVITSPPSVVPCWLADYRHRHHHIIDIIVMTIIPF